MKKTTIYDIAKELNTTISTVSRALNNSDLISESTKRSVRDAAKRLNYRPNKVASSLSSGKTYIIGIIIPSARIHFFSSFVSSLEQEFKKAGYSIILYQTNESLDSEINGVKTLLEAQVDGIIISPSLATNDFSHLLKVQQDRKALLVFDRIDDRIDAPMVSIDDEKAGYLVTKHLIDVGYKRIAYISTASKIKIFEDRYNGYLRALAEHGIAINERFVIKDDVSIESGIKGTKKLLALDEKPDAIIGGDDFTALGIINALHKQGLNPPKIGVVGFANQSFSEYIIPSLTTIDQQASKMGEESVRLFLDMVESNNSVPSLKHKKVVLEPVLIERESTKK